MLPTIASRKLLLIVAHSGSVKLNEIINKLNHIKKNNTRINIPKSE